MTSLATTEFTSLALGAKPNLSHPDGRNAPVGIIHFSDCVGDNITDLRLGINRFVRLPNAKVILERSVLPLEAGKQEIQFLLAVAIGEFGSLQWNGEAYFIANAAPREAKTGNNLACPFIYAKVRAGKTTIHYFGTLGPELAAAIRDGRLDVTEIWVLQMPEDEPFRSKDLFQAVARALDGDSEVFLHRLDPNHLPNPSQLIQVGGVDRFENVALDRRQDEAPFNECEWGTILRFRVGEDPVVHEAAYVKSFGSETGLVFLPGSAMTDPEDRFRKCVYLVINHGHASSTVGGVRPGTVIHFI